VEDSGLRWINPIGYDAVMKPSRFVAVFLLGGIAVCWVIGARKFAAVLGVLLLVFLAVDVLATIFQRPGSDGENHSQ
jgi:hypothetical protein